MTRRVVITGLGAVTPIGLTADDFWDNLVAGKSGIDLITLFDASNFPVKVAGEVKGFEPTDYMHIKRADRTGRCTHFGIAATKMALESARLDMAKEQPERVGVVLATSGMINLIDDEGERSWEKKGM